MEDKDFIKEVFQRATEEFDIEFNPIAWERMEQKLDQARRKRVLVYWFRWGGLALAGMLLMWLFWQTFTMEEFKPKVVKPTIPIVEVPRATEEEEYCPENEAVVEKLINNEKLKNEELLKDKVQNKDIKTQREPYFNIYKIDKKANELNINDSKIALQKEKEENRLATVDSLQDNLLDLNNNTTFYNIEAIAAIELATLKYQKPNETIIMPQPSNDTTDVIKSNPIPQNRWTLGLLGAPEMVSVGFNDVSRRGLSYGLLTEYRFARRFSLSAQGVYAKKNYVAGEGEYNRPGGWANDIVLIQTIGNCEMIEATLSLRTELLQQKRWNLVANTGVSTWWMLQEKYRYKYEPHDPAIKVIYKWQSKETLTHWFGVAQLGIGGEFKLSQKLSMQADFYTQIPLQGLGHGKLQLYSNGLSFSLRRQL